MKLQDIEFIKLLPEFMRDDLTNIGLSKSIDNLIKYLAAYGPKFSIWTAIDILQEDELDKLAQDLNLTWYEKSADISIKRTLIRNSDEMKRNLGTGWAVEQIILAYFGNGHIDEWFEYDGTPGCFKVISSNPSVTQENLNKFLRILEKVKRKSAHLEKVDIRLTARNRLRTVAGKSTPNVPVSSVQPSARSLTCQSPVSRSAVTGLVSSSLNRLFSNVSPPTKIQALWLAGWSPLPAGYQIIQEPVRRYRTPVYRDHLGRLWKRSLQGRVIG